MLIIPGKNLRRIREQLSLKYRDVTEASQTIATKHKNHEFAIGLSRLADIENKGTVPSLFRMYSLATIYGLDFSELMNSYGVPLAAMPDDAASLNLQITKPVSFFATPQETVTLPLNLAAARDFKKSVFISKQLKAWGSVPLRFLSSTQAPHHRYALVGTEDWSMYPIIPPGSFVQVDDNRRKIANSGWSNEFTRPIYFLETRQGYRFGWCTESAGTLIVQAHASTAIPAQVLSHPGEVEVLGQVVAVAMRLDRERPPRKRSS